MTIRTTVVRTRCIAAETLNAIREYWQFQTLNFFYRCSQVPCRYAKRTITRSSNSRIVVNLFDFFVRLETNKVFKFLGQPRKFDAARMAAIANRYCRTLAQFRKLHIKSISTINYCFTELLLVSGDRIMKHA